MPLPPHLSEWYDRQPGDLAVLQRVVATMRRDILLDVLTHVAPYTKAELLAALDVVEVVGQVLDDRLKVCRASSVSAGEGIHGKKIANCQVSIGSSELANINGLQGDVK
jgi:hypothetical protein